MQICDRPVFDETRQRAGCRPEVRTRAGAFVICVCASGRWPSTLTCSASRSLLATARCPPFFPSASRCSGGRRQTKVLGDIQALQTKVLRETQALGDWPANLGKYQPSHAGSDEKGSDGIVASLLCQDGENVIPQAAGIHAPQQVAHDGGWRNVIAQIGNPVGETFAGPFRLAFQLC